MMSLLRKDHANQDEDLVGEVNKKPLKSPLKCFYCHEEGHFKRNCSKRPPPNGIRNRGDWHQYRGGKHVIRGEPSWCRGGSQIRRPRGQYDEVDKELQQPLYEYEGYERKSAGARER